MILCRGRFVCLTRKQKSAPHYHGREPSQERYGAVRYGRDFMGIDGVGQIFQVYVKLVGRNLACSPSVH